MSQAPLHDPGQAACAAERRYRQLFESMVNGFAVHEIILDEAGVPCDYRYLEANPAFERLTGLRVKDILGRRILEVAPGTERHWIDTFGRVALSGETVHFENYWETNRRHYEVVAYRPAPGQFACVFTDVTERKRSEHELRESTALLQAVSSGIPTAMLYRVVRLPDGSRRFTYVSEGVRRLYGCPPEEALADPLRIYGRVCEEDRDRVLAEEEKAFRTLTPFRSRTRMRNPDGGLRWSYFASNPRQLPDGSTSWDGIEIDITEQVRAEEAVQARERRFAQLLQNSFDTLVILDADGIQRYVSASAERMHGHAPAELVDIPVIERMIHPDDQERVQATFRQVIRTGSGGVQYRHRRKGGGWVHLEARATNQLDNPDIRGVVVNVRDITERKKVEDALRESEGHLCSLMQNARGFFFYRLALDPGLPGGGRVLLASPSITEVAGITDPYDFAAWFACIHPEDLPRVLAANQRSLETGEPYDQVTRWYHRLRGRWIWVRTMSTPVFDASGRPTHFNGLCLDITEQKRAEEAVEQERALYKDLVASQPSGVYRLRIVAQEPWTAPEWVGKVGSNYRLELVSDLFCEILGATRAQCEANAAIVVERVHPEDRPDFTARNVQALRTLEPFRWEGRLLAGDRVTWVHFASVPRRLAGGDVIWTGILLDITERKRLEERLHRSDKLQAIGQLAGGVAHDFNNQLAGILGFAEMLAVGLEDRRLKGFAEQIRSAALRSADLTRKLLAFARQGQHRRVPLDVHQSIRETVEILARSVDKRIRIVPRLDACRSRILGDASQVQNALLNLCLNARDAMPEGGDLVISTAEATLDAAGAAGYARDLAPGDHLLVTVTDTGCGMGDEVKAHLFEPFFTTKPQGKGTGLGLASVLGTVQQHGGVIRVESAPGEGTTVRILLPLPPPEAEVPTQPAPAARPPGRRLRILVVDDEPVVRQIAATLLASAGHQVVLAVDGPEAIAMFQAGPDGYDLVLLDMIMPAMNGRDTFRALRRIDPRVKVLIVSGFSLNQEVQVVLDEGASGFVQKPFERQPFLDAVAAAAAGEAGFPRG